MMNHRGKQTMVNPAQMKYVCIHGHFYQPPRENPWLEEIEREASATPYHDWNERINSECYRANTAARLVDDQNRIVSLSNNYRNLSFNFGPTLLRWLEKYDPWVYRSILETDRESCERFGGHGNAMAQSYNHIIMPLANRRDKTTQILWGIRDFEHRFGRRPEGMWLSETAVDRETLSIMADAGLKFTVLSPFQAAQWRILGEDTWRDAPDGTIPTGRAYRYDCGNGKFIDIFFYDAELARGIAFERVLEHSSKFVARIESVHARRNLSNGPEPWLTHTATDGESYGHHFKFGDMALAATLRELERDPETTIMNYGTFLASFPVRAEVRITDNTAWSCAHGLGRWQSDCGCRIGGEEGWNQKWRGPLREAMNYLRDELAQHYERNMSLLAKDPWKARDEYIEVLLAPERRVAEFFQRHTPLGKVSGRMVRFFQLLEMQRYAMFMFTSCGWFFDEISNLESVMIMRYAARAMQLAEQTGAPSFEAPFLKILEKAPSNDPEYGNGANVYLRKVKPEIVEKDRVVANYAIQSVARTSQRQFRLYGFGITPQHEEDLGSNPVPCLYGHIRVADDRTFEEEDYLYAVLHFGGLDFRCSVKPYSNAKEYESILRGLQRGVEEQDTVKMIRLLDEVFGTASFSLHDVFKDLRSSIALEISRKTLGIYTDLQRHMYHVYRPLMSSLRQWSIRIPNDLRVAVRRVLSDEVHQLVQAILDHEENNAAEERAWDATDFFYRAHAGRLHLLLEDARSWGVVLKQSDVPHELGESMVSTLTMLHDTFAPRHAGRFFRLMNVCRDLDLKPELWKLQTIYYDLVGQATKSPRLVGRIKNFDVFLKELDEFLECRF
ncbi:MAG: DUF3536 domain-containing protein, partial [Acidobacteriota bacterium]